MPRPSALDKSSVIWEVPSNGSFQSGIGFISGWVCEGNLVEIIFNDDIRFPIPSRGLSRKDTESACGDADNGFITVFNWNLIGAGTHTVAFVVDGQTVQRHTFTVTGL